MMMLGFKIVVGGLFLVLLMSLARSVSYAMRADVPAHRRWAGISFWIMVGAIVATETMVRLFGGDHGRGLLAVHLSFAVPFALLLGTLRFWITGLQYTRVHRVLAYACLGLYLGALSTGIVLLWKF